MSDIQRDTKLDALCTILVDRLLWPERNSEASSVHSKLGKNLVDRLCKFSRTGEAKLGEFPRCFVQPGRCSLLAGLELCNVEPGRVHEIQLSARLSTRFDDVIERRS